VQLELNDEDVTLLLRILQHQLADLREEVYKTENYDWRESMKKDEATLKDIMARLDAAHVKRA
jgi:hypothetical protein